MGPDASGEKRRQNKDETIHRHGWFSPREGAFGIPRRVLFALALVATTPVPILVIAGLMRGNDCIPFFCVGPFLIGLAALFFLFVALPIWLIYIGSLYPRATFVPALAIAALAILFAWLNDLFIAYWLGALWLALGILILSIARTK